MAVLYVKESTVIFKRVETYFYFICLIWLLMFFEQVPESISINLGLFTLNNYKFSNLNLILSLVCIVLGVICFFLNFNKFISVYSNQIQTYSKLELHVTRVLQSITGSTGDKVSKFYLSGFFNVSVNTGAWTSYQAATTKVIVTIPFKLALIARVYSCIIAFIKTASFFTIPIILSCYIAIAT
jgi:hypothetical protein